MKIVITSKFRKEFKKFSKYCTLQEFVNDLGEENKHFLHIHDSFYKFKSRLNSLDFRGVSILIINEKRIIPLFIALKKDKLYGENIIWETYKGFLQKRLDIVYEELKNGDYLEF